MNYQLNNNSNNFIYEKINFIDFNKNLFKRVLKTNNLSKINRIKDFKEDNDSN